MTRYGLDGPGIESRWGARFSAPVQTDPGDHPTSYTMGNASFPGVKRSGRGVDRPPSSNAEVEGRVELYICSPSGSSWPVLGRTLQTTLTLEVQRFHLVNMNFLSVYWILQQPSLALNCRRAVAKSNKLLLLNVTRYVRNKIYGFSVRKQELMNSTEPLNSLPNCHRGLQFRRQGG